MAMQQQILPRIGRDEQFSPIAMLVIQGALILAVTAILYTYAAY